MQHLEVVWYLLAAASAGVFLHAGIKFPWFVFFQKDSGLRPADPPWNMRLAMILFAALCIGIGVLPGPLYAMLPFPVDFVPYTASHVVFYLQLLLFSGLAFFLMLGWLKRTLTITLDVDWLYRRLGPRAGAKLWIGCAEAAWLGVVDAASAARSRDPWRRSSAITDPMAFSPAPGRPAHGVLDDHHAGRLSGPVVSVIGRRWKRSAKNSRICCIRNCARMGAPSATDC